MSQTNHLTEQTEFARYLVDRMERFPKAQRPTVRALVSAFLTGIETMSGITAAPSEDPQRWAQDDHESSQ